LDLIFASARGATRFLRRSMSESIAHSIFTQDSPAEDSRFLEEQIITYIGNKRALLPFIGRGVEEVKRRLGKQRLRVLDLFSGTGVVARYFKRHAEQVMANDLESYSRVTNECYLSNSSDVDQALLVETLRGVEEEIQAKWQPGFLTELYAPKDEEQVAPDDRVFYTRRNAVYLDTAREVIGKLPAKLQKYFLGPLLADASVHANTAGVFKGFYKTAEGIGQYGGSGRNALSRILGEIRVELPARSRFDVPFEVHQADANDLVERIEEVDLAYLDPPYNQHPYGSNYFMLNLLVDYRRPDRISRVSGIPTEWNRSRYNQRGEVEQALFQLVERCPAKFLLISYNSEGFIPPARFCERLAASGEVTILETAYNTFRGSRNLRDRPIHVKEFLYLVERR
jgi:adenine-specific DNA-methyltransferase